MLTFENMQINFLQLSKIGNYLGNNLVDSREKYQLRSKLQTKFKSNPNTLIYLWFYLLFYFLMKLPCNSVLRDGIYKFLLSLDWNAEWSARWGGTSEG